VKRTGIIAGMLLLTVLAGVESRAADTREDLAQISELDRLRAYKEICKSNLDAKDEGLSILRAYTIRLEGKIKELENTRGEPAPQRSSPTEEESHP
jgi:hypothetical protein